MRPGPHCHPQPSFGRRQFRLITTGQKGCAHQLSDSGAPKSSISFFLTHAAPFNTISAVAVPFTPRLQLLREVLHRSSLGKRLGVILRFVETFQTWGCLAARVALFFLEQRHHVIHRGDYLRDIRIFPREGRPIKLKPGPPYLYTIARTFSVGSTWAVCFCTRTRLGSVLSMSANVSDVVQELVLGSQEFFPLGCSWTTVLGEFRCELLVRHQSSHASRRCTLPSRVNFVSVTAVTMMIASFFAATNRA